MIVYYDNRRETRDTTDETYIVTAITEAFSPSFIVFRTLGSAEQTCPETTVK
jgi:hypothetical protein